MKVDVHPGIVRVDSIDLVYDFPKFKVLLVDLLSKYPDETWESTSQNKIHVFIPHGPKTIYLDTEKNNVTAVEIQMDDAYKWAVMSSGSHYTVTIVLFYEPNITPDTLIWSRYDR